ncbi:uncharacterized protein LOC110738017 [Chenopodium quinoa]|uniref:uncharacterized protein LOC110738017 n=1 Tax=Chenopodium quinoa TaxID=63459 RepID=UPI000B79A84E|nr:uncharacterized protein LOC110738017 [Chenopodium quinoa]
MRKWEPGLDLSEDTILQIPVWVRFPDLNLKFWSQATLMKIAGLVGNPIKTDKATASKELLEYARVMVEVQVDGNFPEYVDFLDEEGRVVHQEVVFEWKPVKCSMYNGLGHDVSKCPNHLVQGNIRTANRFLNLIEEEVDEGNMIHKGAGGLNGPERVYDVLWFLKHNHMGLFGLIETKAVCANYEKVDKGKIWVLWLPSIFEVIVLRVEVQLMHLRVVHRAIRCVFLYMMVYGLNTAKEREAHCHQLIEIAGSITSPWIVCGDFNNILNLEYRLGSPCTLREVEQFRECVAQCELLEAAFGGAFFTWSLMDHCPCSITLFGEACGGNKPFRFFNCWVDAPGYWDAVSSAWAVEFQGTAMFIAFKKLQDEFKVAIELEAVQKRLGSDPLNEEILLEEKLAGERYATARAIKYKFMKQKAKLHWLKEGDINSSYFHACLLGTSSPPSQGVHQAVILEGVVLDNAHQSALCREFSEDDIKAAL